MSIFELFKKIETAPRAAMQGAVEWIICGLGNPGSQYAATRHNAGFFALDALAAKQAPPVKTDRLRFKAVTAETMLALPNGSAVKVLLMKPQTFMNLSGEAVRDALAFYKLSTERLVVMYDDVSLPVGKLRVREKGSDGGHNGIKSIIYLTGTDIFPRVKIGIGAPRPEMNMADWVVGKFSAQELSDVAVSAARAADAAAAIIASGWQAAANQFNCSGDLSGK